MMAKLLLKWTSQGCENVVNLIDPVLRSNFDLFKKELPPNTNIKVVDWATNNPMTVKIGDCVEV